MKIKVNEEYKKLVKRYDSIMMDLCHEFATLTNEHYSEVIKNKEWWGVENGITVKWIKHEIQMMYDSYFEVGHMNYEVKYESPEGNKMWWNETRRLKRFLDTLAKYDDDIVLVEYDED